MGYFSELTDEQKQERVVRGRLISEHGYPEQTWDVLQLVVDLFNLKPPRYKKDKGYWIEGARRLEDACGYDLSVIRAVRKDFEESMNKNNGLAPFTVEGPTSLVKVTRAKAAVMQPDEDARLRKYTEGEYADFINH